MNLVFLLSFSSLALFAHALPLSLNIHQALYGCNVLALVGFCIILASNPTFFHKEFRSFFHLVGLNDQTKANVAMFGAHLFPVVALSLYYADGIRFDIMFWLLVAYGALYLFLTQVLNLTLYPWTVASLIGMTLALYVAEYAFFTEVNSLVYTPVAPYSSSSL
jgi:hypothetical protein